MSKSMFTKAQAKGKACAETDKKIDWREQVYNAGASGPIEKVQLPEAMITLLRGIPLDFDPAWFRQGTLPAGARSFMEVCTGMGSSFNTPFIDFLRGQAESLKRRRGRATGTRASSGPRGSVAPDSRGCCALVDGLVFRVVAQPSRPRRHAERLALRAEPVHVAAADAAPREARSLADVLVQAALLCAGFPCHRGCWRRRGR